MNKDIKYLEKYLPKEKLQEGINRLNNNEPVQYIVGNVDFYGNLFKVNKDVLIPRFETEDLVSRSIKYINNFFDNNVSILDIGTGSGCIAITLSKKINCNADGIDISNDALKVAKENAILNNANVNFFNSDLFENVSSKYDVIISNPPYISYDEKIMDIVKDNEPHLALYASNNGLYFYEKILEQASLYLNNKNMIIFEIGQTQGKEIEKLAKINFPNSLVFIEKDLYEKDRFVFIFNK